MKEKKSWQEWRTTLVGGLTIVASILVFTGVLTPEEQGELNQQGITLIDAVGGIIVAISGIINIFRAK